MFTQSTRKESFLVSKSILVFHCNAPTRDARDTVFPRAGFITLGKSTRSFSHRRLAFSGPSPKNVNTISMFSLRSGEAPIDEFLSNPSDSGRLPTGALRLFVQRAKKKPPKGTERPGRGVDENIGPHVPHVEDDGDSASEAVSDACLGKVERRKHS
jgi:hypothetical protein